MLMDFEKIEIPDLNIEIFRLENDLYSDPSSFPKPASPPSHLHP